MGGCQGSRESFSGKNDSHPESENDSLARMILTLRIILTQDDLSDLTTSPPTETPSSPLGELDVSDFRSTFGRDNAGDNPTANPSSSNNLRIQTPSFAARAIAISSASWVDSAVIVCNLLRHETGQPNT